MKETGLTAVNYPTRRIPDHARAQQAWLSDGYRAVRAECQNSARLDVARKFFGTIDFARSLDRARLKCELRNQRRGEAAFKWLFNGRAHRSQARAALSEVWVWSVTDDNALRRRGQSATEMGQMDIFGGHQ